MRPRTSLFALPIVPALFIIVPLVHQEPATPVEPVAPAPMAARANPGGVKLRNTGAVTIQVEVRAGTQSDCDKAPLVATIEVPAGKDWVIRSSQPLCYRRVGSGPQGKQNPWERKASAEGQVEEVVL